MALYDSVPSQLKAALATIETQLIEMEQRGLMRRPAMTAGEAIKLVTCHENLAEALHGAFYVQVMMLHDIRANVSRFKNKSSIVHIWVIIIAAAVVRAHSIFSPEIKKYILLTYY